jgi:hypothetical protein
MAINLRSIKGSALTHQEMDTNLTSYYVSSSLNDTTLNFFTYGTGSFSATTHSIDLGVFLDNTDRQTLSITGSDLSISNGNTITLPIFDGDYNSLSNQPTLFDGDYNSLSNLPDLFDGDYNSLNNLPDLFDGSYNSLSDLPTLFDGDYNSLSNLPTIPTNVSEFVNDAGYITSSAPVDLTNLVEKTSDQALASTTALTFSGSVVTLTKGDGTVDSIDLVTIQDTNLARIIEGKYLTGSQELEFKRNDDTTFTIDASYFIDDTNLVTSVNTKVGNVTLTTDDINEGLTNFYDKEVTFTGENITINGTYPNFQLTGSNGSVTSVNGQTGDVTLTLFDGDYNSLSNLPTLFDGSYNSLSDLPTLFDGDYNSLSNQPTLFDGDYNSLANLPTIPTNNNQLTNGAGYITSYTETQDLQDVCDLGSTTNTTITAANFITTSDQRLKSNIQPITEGLNTLKRFLSYEYVKDGQQDAGFLAQEVQQAIPYSVFEGKNGYLTMNDRPILAHMHKAILELEQRIAAIESKLD